MSGGRAAHGPWVDVHSHPGQCFLRGLRPQDPGLRLDPTIDAVSRLATVAPSGLAAVNLSTVADLPVLGSKGAGLGAVREFEPGEAVADHRRQVAGLQSLVEEVGVRTMLRASDVLDAPVDASPGVFLSCEGADFLDGALDGLADAHAAGIRSITLVHYRVNELGDIQTEDESHHGLTTFGREVVAEMNRLGIILDLAHATFATTAAALEASSAPIMISHSHLAAPGASHPRLLSVEHAAMVASAGGIIGAWPAGMVLTTLEGYADEICRLVDVVGVEHVAIGTDLDANFKPVLTDYEQFVALAALLQARGLTAGDVDAVFGGNFLRLFAAVCG